MSDALAEWLHLFLRWFHVIAGFTWLGQTHLFNRLEKWMSEEPPKESGNLAGTLWMVHGGGFYYLQKQKKPEKMPETLRWFKWQSMLTWISGFFLMLLLFYYIDNGAALAKPGVGFGTAAVWGLAILFLSWPVYVLLWRSPIGKNEPVGVAICFALTMGVAYQLSECLGDRAMYLHVGAMFGTIMTANVWLIIIPSQKELIDAINADRAPDMSLAASAKQASKHNTYMSVPLIVLMLASHFGPITYGSGHALPILAALIIVGWIAARIIRG